MEQEKFLKKQGRDREGRKDAQGLLLSEEP